MSSDKLIEELTLDLQPTRKLAPLATRFFQWSGLSLLWGAAFLFLHGWRSDIADQLQRTSFILEIVLPFALSMSAALFALQLRTPVPLGRLRPGFLSLGLLAWITAFGYHSWEVGMLNASMDPVRDCRCFAISALLPVVPGMILYRQLLEGTTTSPRAAGLFVGLASGLLIASLLPLACERDGGFHVLFGHILPLGVLFALLWHGAQRILRW